MSKINAIEIKNLHFKYGTKQEQWILNAINLCIQQGDFIVILGATGAGKSTLIKCLNGIIPNQIEGEMLGEVIVNGIHSTESSVKHIAKTVGVVYQDYETQLFCTEVQDDIVFALENYNYPRNEMKEILKKTLNMLGLPDYENTYISTLSGGQKQKVAIGGMLALSPEILVLDEPTTDLDPISKEAIFQLSDILRKDKQKHTIILAEQEIEESLKADKLIAMDKGKIAYFGDSKAFFKDVPLAGRLGIKALQIPQYFHELHIKKEILPLTPREGAALFEELSLTISEHRYQSLVLLENEEQDKRSRVIISAKALSFAYKNSGKMVLEDINCDIYERDFISIIGHNGCGKTTFTKLLNGLNKPQYGELTIAGESTKNTTTNERSKEIAYVFQNPDHQIFCDTVYDEIAFGLRNQGVSEDDIKQRCRKVLQVVGLSDKEEEEPFTLTKGEREKIAVASALVTNPQILILDEPTTGLDYREQKEIMDILRRLNAQGCTIILVTHTMWVAAEYSNRIIAMDKGKIAADKTPREFFSMDDSILKKLSLKMPPIIQMSKLLGKTMLSVEEMYNCTSAVKERVVRDYKY